MCPSPALLSLRWLPEEAGWRRFELTSRGDRVVARLHPSTGPSPHPLAVVLAEAAQEVSPIDGCATLALDLPLLGARAHPKWTERLRRCLANGVERASDEALLEELRCQAAADLAGALDVCRRGDEIGPRAGLLGLGAGAWVGARLRATERRLGVVILAPGGLAASLDPREAGAAAPRGLIFVRDAAEGARRLRDALA